jgi:uncharacterized protein (TIGR02284 family)
MPEHSHLNALYTSIVDARNGYGVAAEDASREDMRALFENMIALHEAALNQLRPELEARGEKPNDDGSFMSTVNETVVSVRSAVTGLAENALSAFASGEERILKGYDRAIEEAIGDRPLADTLARQRQELAAHVGEMRATAEKGGRGS